MFLRNKVKMLIEVCKNVKTVSGDKNSNFLGSIPFKPLKINNQTNFNWLCRVHSKVSVKKKLGRNVDLNI
jgi:hypothetical protein